MKMNNKKKCVLSNTPKLYIRNCEMLFLGAYRFPFRAFKVIQERLVVCLDGTMSVRLPDGARINCRSCLLRTGLVLDRAIIDVRRAVVAVAFLHPLSQDACALAGVMREVYPGISVDHPTEAALQERMLAIRNGASMPPDEAYRALGELLIPADVRGKVFRAFDDRILEVVKKIRASIRENLSLNELASGVNLSASRLEKLFKEQTGAPITQYRLQYRVLMGITLIAQGCSITDASLAAGFSNSAHFSRSFSSIYGVAPSTTFMRPPYLETFVDDGVQNWVSKMMEGQSL